MADQHNDGVPAVGNQIVNDIPDIKENLEWHKDVLQMLVGWKDSTIATVGPPNHRAAFAYSDTDTITIGAGSYFHDGTTRQTVFWDSALTFDLGSGGSNTSSDDLTASAWHYIYLDDSAIVTQASSELDKDCFRNETTAPTWNASKHGWYQSTGNDMCIFAVLTNGSSEIIEFLHAGNIVYFANSITSYSAGAPSTTWADATLSGPGFCTKFGVSFYSIYVNACGTVAQWRTNGQTGATGHNVLEISCVEAGDTYTEEATVGGITVISDTSQKIEVRWAVSTTNTITVYTDGWYLPDGM